MLLGQLLTDNKEKLDRLAKALVEYETLTRDEMERVVRGEKLKDKLKVDVGAAVKVPEGNVMPPLPLPPLGGATGGKGGSEEGVGSPSA